MTIRWTTLALALAMLMALASGATAATNGTWKVGCGTTVTNSLIAKQSVCWNPAANTDDAPHLMMDQCENVDIMFFPDYAATSNDSTVPYDILVCPNGGVADGDVAAACQLMDQVPTTETVVSAGATVGWLRIESADSGNFPTSGQWQVKCNP